MSRSSNDKVFKCSICQFSAPYTVFGRSLPSDQLRAAGGGDGSRVVFLEDSYLLPDPNAVRQRPLFLGAHCSLCGDSVCGGEACSLFYAKRFCARCARDNVKAFPDQCVKLAPKIFAQQPSEAVEQPRQQQ
mmetsp:Transcript_32260/g.71392  ORF Transcript_32260/g.71392 Transcript_32260/m.71392 type:complete len:131 (-) Transcript_32260:385-777(-)